MKHHIHRSPIYYYRDITWLVNANQKYGLRTDILKAVLDQLAIMLDYHKKVFIFRFDLHPPAHTDNNKKISDFNRQLFRRIKYHYKTKRVGYAWVREIETAKKQHYHLVLILDGSKVNHPHQIQQWIVELWGFIDGASHWAGYHNIERGNNERIQKAAHHISYLAKPRGKGYRPQQTKDFSTSRLKPKGGKV